MGIINMYKCTKSKNYYRKFSRGMTMPEVVSMSVTRAEFLLCLASCWKSVEPATPRLGPRRRRLFIQKQQFLTESRKCYNRFYVLSIFYHVVALLLPCSTRSRQRDCRSHLTWREYDLWRKWRRNAETRNCPYEFIRMTRPTAKRSSYRLQSEMRW